MPADKAARQEITLVSGGASEYVIVVPDGEDVRDRVKKAADLLQSSLEEATGCRLPVVKESAAPTNRPHICLGKTGAAIKAGVPFDKLKGWTFCKRAAPRDIFLAGCDASANIKGPLEHHDREYLMMLQGLAADVKDRSYKEYLGTYKAVTSFLEDEVGVRFLMPGPNGLHIPKTKGLKVDAKLDFVGSARFPYCYGRNYGDVTIALNHNEIPFYKNYGGHSFPVAVPKWRCRETHPEYFVLVDGKRQPEFGAAGGGHLCISNLEVQELMMRELERQYDYGFDWVQIGQTDGMTFCECDTCRALAGNDAGEALWIVYRKMAEEMKKRRPDKKIVFLAYGDTKQPPKTFDSFPDNVLVEMCAFSTPWEEMLTKWKKFRIPKLVYTYNWGAWHTTTFSPKRSPAYVSKQLRLFADNGVQGIFKCGWGEALGLEGPVYYVYSKLLFDPYIDPQMLADDFYRAAYGRASSPMKKLFDALYASMDFKDGHSKLDLMHVRPHNPSEQLTYLFQPGTLLYMEKQLSQALAMDQDPRVQARLKLVEREFKYLKTLVSIHVYWSAYRLSGSKGAAALLEAEIDARTELVASWYDENGRMKMEPGFNWPFFDNVPKTILNNGGGAILSPYPGLDIDEIRNKPASGAALKKRSFQAAYLPAKGPVPNGK